MGKRNTEAGRAKRVVVIVTAIIIIAALAVGGYFVWKNHFQSGTVNVDTGNHATNSPNSVSRESFNDDDYDGWQTYTSTKNGFSIQYPADWFAVPETDIDSLYVRNKNLKLEPGEAYPSGAIDIRVFKTVDADYTIVNMTAEGWFNILGTDTVSDGAVSYKPEDVTAFTLNGQDAKRLKSVLSNTTEDILVLKNGELYTLRIYPYDSVSDDTVKKILASFTVTE